MFKAVLFSMVFSLFVVQSAPPLPPVTMPEIREGESRELKVTHSFKGKAGRGQKMTMNFAAKRIKTRVVWKGEGAAKYLVYERDEILQNKCRAVHTFNFKPRDELVLRSYERVISAPGGKTVQKLYFDFTISSLGYPPVLLHPFILELAFRSFDMTPGAKRTFNLWLGEAVVLLMHTNVEGIETIDLPNEKGVRCYRISMKPDFSEDFGAFANRVLSPLIPDYTFWMKADGSKVLVKYVGPMGQVSPVGAPTETHELLSYIPGKGG